MSGQQQNGRNNKEATTETIGRLEEKQTSETLLKHIIQGFYEGIQFSLYNPYSGVEKRNSGMVVMGMGI